MFQASPINIQEVKNNKARNILRGIDSNSNRKVRHAIEKIKRVSDESDYKKTILILRTTPIFEDNNVIPQVFSRKCIAPTESITDFSIDTIFNLIEYYNEDIALIFELFEHVFQKICFSDFLGALKYCDLIVESKGVSVYLIKIISFIANRCNFINESSEEILIELNKLRKKIQISNYSKVSDAISQLTNLRVSHFGITKRINELSDDYLSSYVIKFFLNPISKNEEHFKKTLNSMFSYSLVDAFLYFKFSQNVGVLCVENYIFPNDINERYTKISSFVFSPDMMFLNVGYETSTYYLRESFLFIEQKNALDYLLVHNYFYNKSNESITPFYIKNMVDKYFSNLNSFEEIRNKSFENVCVQFSHYDSETCGILENSCALMYLIEKKQGVLDKKELELFVSLMSYTRDIGEICRLSYLEKISYYASTSVQRLVSSCLVYINKKSNYSDHQLRTMLQDICKEDFEGDLISLFDFFYEISPSVTEYLLNICDEKFLSTLFHLTDKPIDALRTRADIFDWYGKKTNDEAFIERAKTLRVDVQIYKEKGTIDDSRIYVDPLKYKQWFEDFMLNRIIVALDSVLLSTGTNTQPLKVDWNKTSTISATDALKEALLLCYKEFCENKNFGIASYLGRRIRHGTFEGTATTDLNKLESKSEYRLLFENATFKKIFDSWLHSYDKMIKDLQNNYLYIKSKKKSKGLIVFNINNSFKIQNANIMLHDIFSIYSSELGVHQISNLVIEHCWRLVESDLIEIRKLLSEKKNEFGIFKSKDLKDLDLNKKIMGKFVQDVNSLTSQKFGLMASWFNKPNYASPSTDIYLLFKAVVSEVKDSFRDFSPKIHEKDESFKINGGAYYVIYDALYILIHNAAKHGKSDGRLIFDVNSSKLNNVVNMKVCTEVFDMDSLRISNDNILKLLNSDDEDANIIEGNSGIKKLRKLSIEGGISNINYYTDGNELLLCFEFDFELGKRGKHDVSIS